MKKTALLIFSLAFAILPISTHKIILRNNAEDKFSYLAKAASKTYTVGEYAKFLENKKEHYPFSDEFIEKYQQTGGGYIDEARKYGIEINRFKHEPNQKWHFFFSWIELGEIPLEDDAKSRIYSKLQCPELLLWIYEASGTNVELVKNAEKVAEEGKVQGLATSTIAKNMRAIVSWDALIENLEK